MCNWVPLITTMSILVNSITLVCIALDRYMAVVKVVLKSLWEPKAIFCVIGFICVWMCGAGIASPMYSAYFIMDIYVAETDPNNRTIGIRKYPAQVCINNKEENATYFTIVFICIFLPAFMAFLWLNTIIAIEIWNRRNPLEQKLNNHEGSSSSGTTDSSNQKPTEGKRGKLINPQSVMLHLPLTYRDYIHENHIQHVLLILDEIQQQTWSDKRRNRR